MAKSYRVTEIRIDSDALTRLMEVARQTDLYESRAEAADDNYEAVINLLADRFEAEPELLRESVSAKYNGGSA